MPRKNLFDVAIKPNLDKIQQMAAQGLTQEEIASALGINGRTFRKYIQRETDLKQALNTGREVAVQELENALFKAAVGYKEKLAKGMKVKKTIYENGRKKSEVETVEPYTEEVLVKSDTQAAIFLLMNWAKDRYSKDPVMVDLKKREVELKEKASEYGDEEDVNPFS